MTELQPGGRRARAGARQAVSRQAGAGRRIPAGRGRAGGRGPAQSGPEAGPAGGAPLARVTLQDVADRAGVSLSTASRVVNEGSRRVGPRLADRVTKAVADLGYMANLQARAVATGQSTMMGVIVHDIADPYFSSIAAGLIEVSHARRPARHRVEHGGGRGGGAEYVSLMRAQRARSVVLVGSRSADIAATAALRAEVGAFTRDGGRAVCVGQDLLGVDTILPGERRAGAQALAGALVALGHREFAVLAGPRRAGHRPGPGGRVRGRAGRLVGQTSDPRRRDPRRVYPGRRLPGHERDPGGRRHPCRTACSR